jgi:dimethylamine monooxygenase subunit A
MNSLIYANPDLHQPGHEATRREERRSGHYLRAERQSFVRLPVTGVVLFAIHTYVVTLDSLSVTEREGLEGARL